MTRRKQPRKVRGLPPSPPPQFSYFLSLIERIEQRAQANIEDVKQLHANLFQVALERWILGLETGGCVRDIARWANVSESTVRRYLKASAAPPPTDREVATRAAAVRAAGAVRVSARVPKCEKVRAP